MHKYFALTAWMILAIFGLGLPPQQQVQPVSGVLTLNLVPGTSSFKVILSANVTSVVIQNPTPGTIISVIFTENATGGFSVTFGGNISNPCTVATAANAVTVCQLTYDSSSNTWNGISGSGGGGGGGPTTIAATMGDSATGAALTTSEVRYVTIPFSCTIKGWHIMADAGTVTVKVAKVSGGTALPTIGSNSISTSGVSLSSGTKVDSTTLTDFTTTSIFSGDTLGYFITAVVTAKQVTFQLDCQ